MLTKNGSHLKFYDFIFYNQFDPALPPGRWNTRVKVLRNKEVRLIYSREGPVYYVKSSQKQSLGPAE